MKRQSGRFLRAVPKAGFVLLLASTPLSSETLICDDPLFTVSGEDPATLERVCRVATDARPKLAQCGVVLENPLEIEVTETIDNTVFDCLAVYHCDDDRIELLSPSAMSAARDREGAFELISDEAFWPSVIVHEMTHAAYDRVNCPFEACFATSEYAAFVMQVRSLPENERALFGQNVTLSGKPTRDAVNPMMLYLSPDHFAAYAWLHFQDRHDPCGYMSQLMDGAFFFDSDHL